MEEIFFIFSDKKGFEQENIIYIGENGDYKTLESYLRIEKEEFVWDFTKSHLSKQYFSNETCFITFLHENPLQLRLQEPLIPRKSLVIADKEIDLEDTLLNKFQYEDDDYDIFSGREIDKSNITYEEEIYDNINILTYSLYQMIDAGYLEDNNDYKINDWIITFQEPILDIFIRYHRLETSAPDISITDEFLINPEFRKTICIMLMKIISNFIVNNEIVTSSDLEDYVSWESIELWDSIRSKIKNEF